MEKSIYITQNQLNTLNENINITIKSHNVDPEKVLLVKRYLDKAFKKASLEGLGDDGYPKTTKVVAMLGNDGNPLKLMSDVQLFYLLQDRFKGIYSDINKRDSFLKTLIKDWYADKISPYGLLSVNRF